MGLAAFDKYLLGSIALYGINHDQTVKKYERLLPLFVVGLENLASQEKYIDAKLIYGKLIQIAEKYFPDRPSLSELRVSLGKLPEN
mgnify:CR=1 FL=1